MKRRANGAFTPAMIKLGVAAADTQKAVSHENKTAFLFFSLSPSACRNLAGRNIVILASVTIIH